MEGLKFRVLTHHQESLSTSPVFDWGHARFILQHTFSDVAPLHHCSEEAHHYFQGWCWHQSGWRHLQIGSNDLEARVMIRISGTCHEPTNLMASPRGSFTIAKWLMGLPPVPSIFLETSCTPQGGHLRWVQQTTFTLPTTDIAPENRSSQKESGLRITIAQGLC